MPAPDDLWNEAVAHAVEYATREATPSPRPPPSWSTLKSLEPRLSDLEADVRGIEAGPRFCASAVWIRTLKPRLVALVGHVRGIDEMPKPERREAPVNIIDLVNGEAAQAQTRDLRDKRHRDMRAGRGALWKSDAYDVAYDHLYDLLPDCGDDCACQQMTDALLGLPRGRLHAG